MPTYRSKTSTAGRNMAGARSLWRATGMKDEDFAKPIIAIANSFTQFVPGHVHLKDLGQLVAREIEAAGGVAKEFNTIAVDDGIAAEIAVRFLRLARAPEGVAIAAFLRDLRREAASQLRLGDALCGDRRRDQQGDRRRGRHRLRRSGGCSGNDLLRTCQPMLHQQDFEAMEPVFVIARIDVMARVHGFAGRAVLVQRPAADIARG